MEEAKNEDVDDLEARLAAQSNDVDQSSELSNCQLADVGGHVDQRIRS